MVTVDGGPATPERAARVLPYLQREPALHGIAIAVLTAGDPAYLAIAECAGAPDPVAVGVCTEIKYLVSRTADPSAASALAEDAARNLGALPGWLGPQPEIRAFTEAWIRATAATQASDSAPAAGTSAAPASRPVPARGLAPAAGTSAAPASCPTPAPARAPGSAPAAGTAPAPARAPAARPAPAPRLALAMRIYTLDRPPTPPASPVPGACRPATEADAPLLAQWRAAFTAEVALGPAEHGDDRARIDRAIAEGTLRVWEDGGRVVSMARSAPGAPDAARISLVYTPPALRRHGYASACVAALSAELLRAGRRYCYLYADLANPVSNGIYQRIGYRPAADVEDWRPADAP